MDEVEKLVDRGGRGEVFDVDGTTGSSVGSTKNDLEGSRRVLRLLFDPGVRSRNDELARSIERCSPGDYSSGCCTYGNPLAFPNAFIPGRPIPNVL